MKQVTDIVRYVTITKINLVALFLMTISFSTVVNVIFNNNKAQAFVKTFSEACYWMQTEPSKPSTGQMDTLYVGTGGNRMATISSNVNGLLTLPISSENWYGWAAERWNMGIHGLSIKITNGKNQIIHRVCRASNSGSSCKWWYPNKNNATRIDGNCLGHNLWWATINLSTVKLDVSKLPSGRYNVILSVDGPLATNGANVSEPYSSTSTLVLNNPWHINGQSYIGNSGRGSNGNANNRVQSNNAYTMRPHQKLYFDHDLRNIDNTTMGNDVTINVNHKQYNLDNGSLISNTQNPKNAKDRGGPNELFYINHNDVTITQDHVGRKLCQNIDWTAKSWNEAGIESSSEVCASIPYHYPGCSSSSGCTPNSNSPSGDCTYSGGCPGVATKNGISLAAKANRTEAMAGDTIKFSYSLSNAGPTKSRPLTYNAYTFILRAGQNLPSNFGNSVAYDRSWWGGNGVGCGGRGLSSSQQSVCKNTVSGSDLVVMPGVVSSINGEDIVVSGDWLANPGDQICSYIATDKWSVYNGSEANSYAASNIACVRVGKKPQLQIKGGDSYAKDGFIGSEYNASSSIIGNDNRGSYSQFGLLTTNGKVDNFGSAGYTNISNLNKAKSCKLAWANVATASGSCTATSNFTPGRLSKTATVPAMPSSAKPLSNNLYVSTLNNGIYKYDGELNILGSTIRCGVKATIYATNGVKISNNIYHQDNCSGGTAGLPQLNIIANNGDIKIDPAVHRIDANLLTRTGSVNTCADVSAASSDLGSMPSAKCNRKLVINGAIVSKKSPVFRRTFGAGNQNYYDQYNQDAIMASSETINYNPSVWLANYLSGEGGISSFNVIDANELPVRF